MDACMLRSIRRCSRIHGMSMTCHVYQLSFPHEHAMTWWYESSQLPQLLVCHINHFNYYNMSILHSDNDMNTINVATAYRELHNIHDKCQMQTYKKSRMAYSNQQIHRKQHQQRWWQCNVYQMMSMSQTLHLMKMMIMSQKLHQMKMPMSHMRKTEHLAEACRW